MKIIADKARIDDIADAVRRKLGVETLYKLEDIPPEIDSIYAGGELEPLNATENGDYTPGDGVEGFSSVHVSVPGATLTTKSITANGTYNASSDNADGYSSVTVNVSGGGSAVVQSLSVTQNGTYNPPSGVDGYAPVTVNVSGGTTSPTLKIIDSTVFQHYNSIANRYASSPLDQCLPSIAFKSYNNNSSVFPRLANSQFDGVSTPSFYKPSGALTGVIFLQTVDKAYNKLYIKAKSAVKVSGQSSSILLAIGSSNMAFNADGWLTNAEKVVALASSDYTAEQIMAQENLSIVSSDPSLLSEQTIVYSIPNAASDYFIGMTVWNQEIYISDMYLTVE